jgi:transposase
VKFIRTLCRQLFWEARFRLPGEESHVEHREWGVRLTQQERSRLQDVAQAADVPKQARVRATQLLMSSAGDSSARIAEVLGITDRTVQNTRRRWRRESFNSLADAPRSGRPPTATREYLKMLCSRAQKNPMDLGFAFGRWTCPRLAEYLKQETGIDITPGWVGELLRAHGFVWRKSKLTIRNLQDPVAKASALKRLRRLKKGLCAPAPTMSSGLATA